MKPFKLKVVLKLLTPLHVGGEPGNDANTSYILRGADKKAYYPGTAFKGKVRHYASQLSKDECLFYDQDARDDASAARPVCKCVVCRLFGDEGNAKGSVFFGNFTDQENQLSDIRMGVSIDRYRRVAIDERLFSIESAAVKELTGYVTGSADDGDIAFLKASIKLIRQIGGNTSRGFGWLETEPEIYDETRGAADAEDGGGAAQCVKVTLIPRSPMLIGTHTTQSNFRDTQMTVPGAVLRAALARSLCEMDGTTDAAPEGIKTELPKDRETSFKNLRQEFSGLRFSSLNSCIQGEPYPITARKCKSNDNHKMVDVLAALIKGEKEQCPECGDGGRLEKVEPFEGIQDYEKLHDRKLTVTSTHSQIDRFRGTAQDERLFTVRTIAPNDIKFYGTISGKLDMAELSQFTRAQIHVGAMTSSGFGLCDFRFEPVVEKLDPDENIKDMKKRVEEFNTHINRKGFFIPITLMSDAVVDLEEPEDGNYLKAYEKFVSSALSLHKVITKLKVWRGFDTGKGVAFEKDAVYMIQAGSVLVAFAENLNASVLDELAKVEREGIGCKREDGYGAVRIAHAFHIDRALKRED